MRTQNLDENNDSYSNSAQGRNTHILETFADMDEDAAPRKSMPVSNPNTSTPNSQNVLPPCSSFIKDSTESRTRRRSTSDIEPKTFPQASGRRCASQESTPTKEVQVCRICHSSKSESYSRDKPDSLCGGITAFSCPTEVSRPIMNGQREEREEMKRKAQCEREQAARVTNLGLDCNVLADREQNSLENDLQSVSSSVISSEHMSLENIDLETPNTGATLEISQNESIDLFHSTESNGSDVKDEVGENLMSTDVSMNNKSEGDQQNGKDVLTDLQTSSLETCLDIRECIVSPNTETVSDPKTSTPNSQNVLPPFKSFIKDGTESCTRRRSTSDSVSKTFPQASGRGCASQESTPTKNFQVHRICCSSKSESYSSHKPDSLCGRITAFPCPTEVSRPIMNGQREEREEMKRKAQCEREQAARVTKLGLDCNVLANREQNSLENDLQSVSFSVISSEHMSLGNIDPETPNTETTSEISQSENIDSLTESDGSDVKVEVSENLMLCDVSLNNEREDVLTDLQYSLENDLSISTTGEQGEQLVRTS